jgi:5-methylcytosine-specific restriction protein B
MPSAPWAGEAIYSVAERFRDDCLIEDGSLFTPGGWIWTESAATEFHASISVYDSSDRTFGEKLQDQLTGISAEAVQFAAEALYIVLLAEDDTSAETKCAHIDKALSVLTNPIDIPADLRSALKKGFARYGQGGLAKRYAHLIYLASFVIALKTKDATARRQLLGDPHLLRTFAYSVPANKGQMQREALLHLLLPRYFEPAVSSGLKQRIATAFSEHVDDPNADVDVQLRTIRAKLSPTYTDGFSFWDEAIRPKWDVGNGKNAVVTTVWDEFVDWAEKLYANPAFDVDERDYKIRVGARLEAARQALDSPEWFASLKAAFAGENNLTSFFEHGKFLRWAEENPEQARAFLRSLWDGDAAGVLRGAMFEVPKTVLPGRAARASLASFLLMGVDVFDRPFFRNTVYTVASRLAGREIVTASATVEDLYHDFLALLDTLRQSLEARGTPLRDRIDAQGIVWMIAQGNPPEEWSDDEKRAFRTWHGGTPSAASAAPPAAAESSSMIQPIHSALADELFIDRPWLQEIVDLLNDKRQAIFYGPPGTGKTYVAQRLGEHVEQGGGTWELIQFHPGFSYEDFFEGFRPAVADTGTGVAYELRHGPLRRIAERASNYPDVPHVLVIDEINRGNVAKIFGELYFLLEYRDRGVALQYSPDERFSLPKNLYVIGTMNTADRSIALVDAALRRRFYFIPFLPTEQPLKDVLRKWLASEGLDARPAEILDRLNAAIGAQEFSIGHSYFMGAPGSGGIDLDRVWRFAIKPLLEEHYYGTGRDVDAEFGFDALERGPLEVLDDALGPELDHPVEP